MKRTITATCLAAAFAVGVSAQSAGTSGTVTQEPTAGGQGRGGGPRTATGCLRAGETAGTYMLTDVTMQGGGGRRGSAGAAGGTATGTGTSAGTGTGAGTTAGTGTGAGTTASGGQGRGGGAVQTLMLNADVGVDLKPHVGHKMEVTGTMAGGGGRRGTAGGTATGTGAAAGTATGTGTGTGTTAQGRGRGGTRTMNVTAIKMIANSCN